MTVLSEVLLDRLKAGRIPGLDLDGDFVYPAYGGQSILNIPSSICAWLGAPGLGAGPLAPEIVDPLAGQARCVITILMDALPYNRFLTWLEQPGLPAWNRLLDGGGALAPISSITPSTTSAAITTLWTGRSAAEHGIAGYELWLKEYGVVANMITHRPMSFWGASAESLGQAGFNPEAYLPFPTLGEHLGDFGIKSFVFQHHSIAHSGLSRMFFKNVTIAPVSTTTDLWINLRSLLEAERDSRLFVWVYWGEVDHLSHIYGPEDERPEAEFAAFSHSMQELLLNRLSPEARRGTLLLLTADHGQISTQKLPHYDLRNHPGLTSRLHMFPTGENRLTYLFPHSGEAGAVREYIDHAWPGEFAFADPAHALDNGLFGPGEPHPAMLDRLGDLVVAARGRSYLWWGKKENMLIGRHGGLSPEEMIVPLAGAWL